MDMIKFMGWMAKHHCDQKEIRNYVAEFTNDKLNSRLNRSTTISYNLRLDIYHVTDDYTGEDLYSGDLAELERLLALSDMNNIRKEYLKRDEFDRLMYDMHIAYKYG